MPTRHPRYGSGFCLILCFYVRTSRDRIHPERSSASSRRRRNSAANAHIKSFEEYEQLYDEAAEDVPAFWAKQAEALDWFKKWDTVLEWNEPFREVVCRRQDQYFVQLPRPSFDDLAKEQGGVHLGRRARRAANADLSTDCIREVCRFANVLKKLGVRNGRPRRSVYAARA